MLNIIKELYPLLEYLTIPVYVKSKAGKYLYVNDLFAKKFNLSPTQIIGKTIFDIAPLEIAESYTKSDQEILNNKHRKTVPCIHSFINGQNFVNKIPLLNHLGTPQAILGFLGKNVFLMQTLNLPNDKNKKIILSPREVEVCQLIVYGASFKEIARELNISPHTVVSHQKSIYTKLNIKSKTSLIFLYMGLA